MIQIFIIIACANYEDSRREINVYSETFMLMTLQHLTEHRDSKEIVDRAYKISKENTIENFTSFSKQLFKNRCYKHDELSMEGYNYKNIEKNCSFMILYELLKKTFKHLKDSSQEEKQNLQILTDEFLENNFFSQEKIFDDVPIEIIKTDFGVESQELRDMITAIEETWHILYKKTIPDKFSKNSSIIMLKNSFTIPGGRFRELYYWDSYWIFDGQLAFGMDETVLLGIDNFVDLIQKYGFIPNGTRKYYLKRSQPPYFIQMINNFYIEAGEKLRDSVTDMKYIKAMVAEYNFWMTKRNLSIIFDDEKYFANYYSVLSDYPRPEALTEDIGTFTEYLLKIKDYKLTEEEFIEIYNDCKRKNTNSFLYKDEECDKYSDIKSAAESGWDFSTRFFKDGANMYTICTRELVPVDLNAILYSNELILSKFYNIIGNQMESDNYKNAASKRKQMINKILWKDGSWRDFNHVEEKHTLNIFYFSNIMPMIYGIEPPTGNIYDLMYKYRKVLFSYKGGIPVSNSKSSSQQWDFPNAWPPHQHLFVTFLIKINEIEMAKHVASALYRSIKQCCKKNLYVFYEKYRCDELGVPGGKGEYPVQDGFGWTNGVITRFIKIFKDEILISEAEHAKNYTEIVSQLRKKSQLQKCDNEEERNI